MSLFFLLAESCFKVINHAKTEDQLIGLFCAQLVICLQPFTKVTFAPSAHSAIKQAVRKLPIKTLSFFLTHVLMQVKWHVEFKVPNAGLGPGFMFNKPVEISAEFLYSVSTLYRSDIAVPT